MGAEYGGRCLRSFCLESYLDGIDNREQLHCGQEGSLVSGGIDDPVEITKIHCIGLMQQDTARQVADESWFINYRQIRFEPSSVHHYMVILPEEVFVSSQTDLTAERFE